MASSSTDVSWSNRPSAPKLEYDFSVLPIDLKKELAIAMDGLCFQASRQPVKLRPIKLRNCNAADSSRGKTFSKAYCDVEMDSNGVFLFGDIFHRGLDILLEFLEHESVTGSRQEKFVLNKLLSYIKTAEDEMCLPTEDLDQLNKAEFAILLANHLYGKLSSSNRFLINKNWSRKMKNRCPCADDCELTGMFGDTSAGNGQVWHGNLSIVVNSELVIELLEDNAGSNEECMVKAKRGSSCLSQNAQIVAETIVFSFVQKQTRPEWSHFLTPCIAVGGCEMLVMFYDAEHDVLLESSTIPLFESTEDPELPRKVSLVAILVSWLVANYKYLCSGLTEEMKKLEYKADFVRHMKDKTDIYEKKMAFGNVEIPARAENVSRKRHAIVSSAYLYKKHQKLSKVICEETESNSSSD